MSINIAFFMLIISIYYYYTKKKTRKSKKISFSHNLKWGSTLNGSIVIGFWNISDKARDERKLISFVKIFDSSTHDFFCSYVVEDENSFKFRFHAWMMDRILILFRKSRFLTAVYIFTRCQIYQLVMDSEWSWMGRERWKNKVNFQFYISCEAKLY